MNQLILQMHMLNSIHLIEMNRKIDFSIYHPFFAFLGEVGGTKIP